MGRKRNILLVILLMMGLFSAYLWPQIDKSVRVNQVKEAPLIDGILNEAAWGDADIAGDFIQFEPQKGQAASFRTEARILQTESHLYIGVYCYDPEPDRIIASLTKRDSNLFEDDNIGIGLDTYLDRRTAYFFFTNVLGTQMDGRLADNGRTSDSTWDGRWSVKSARRDDGWSCEIAIPFAILKFQTGKERIWGLGITRSVPRLLETTTWTGPVEAQSRVSQFGKLENLELKKSAGRLVMIPHFISRFQQHKDTFVSAGLDARYAFSQTLSGDLTVNPDFATVEADQEKVNLTRFELSLSEKRNFFLEGSEIYRQRIRLFYSRRISDIYGGLKLYGKKGGYEYSAMSVQSKADDARDIGSANYSVFRLRRDIFKSSNIGFLAANKLVGGRNYGNLGLDIVHFFSEKVNFTGQLAMSYGNYNSKNLAFFLRPSYDSATFHIHLRYTQLGKRFADNANSVGFVRDDDRHELDSAVEKTWWIKKHGIDRLTYDSNYNIYWSLQGLLRSWKIDQSMELDLTSKFSLEVDYTGEYKLYEKDFYNNQLGVELGYNTREWQSVSVNYETGRNFDLDYQLFGGNFNYKLLKSLSFQYGLNRLFMDPDPENESTWIHSLRLTNYFTNDLYFKFYYQTNTAIAKYSFQALFVYRFQPPFGTIQLAYQKGTSRFGIASEQGHTLFFKVSYVF